ncbi:MAG TPA: DUF3416 domain-containing protein, partial [Bordetella sp.]|nr:DUF3416 domain-containing protein [Bordetella sp.]
MESPNHRSGISPGPLPATEPSLRIYYVRGTDIGRPGESAADPWDALCRQVRAAGFNAVLTDPLWLRPPGAAWSAAPLDPDRPDPRLASDGGLPDLLRRVAASGARHGLPVYMDLVLDRIATDSTAHAQYPDWYRAPQDDPARDPRMALSERGIRHLRSGPLPQGFIHDWSERLARWLDAGLAGFRIDAPDRIGADDWHAMLAPLRAAFPDRRFLAWTPGLQPGQLQALRTADFDAAFSSLPWWDFRSPWLAEEHTRLCAIGSVIAMPPDTASAHSDSQAMRALWAAAVSGDGILVQGGLDTRQHIYAQLNDWL